MKKNTKVDEDCYLKQDEVMYLIEKLLSKKKDFIFLNKNEKKLPEIKKIEKVPDNVIFLYQDPKKEKKKSLVFNLSSRSNLTEEDKIKLDDELKETLCFIEKLNQEESLWIIS